MYLMYIDEAGDPGLTNSPTRYFILSGLVVHELRWQQNLDALIAFRRRMRNKFGLKLRDEIHSAKMFTRPGALARIPKQDRLAIIRAFTHEVATLTDVSVINIVVDKANHTPPYDPMVMAWKALIQRFENTMTYRNFPGPANSDDKGMLIPDFTATKKVRGLLRQMRRFNPIPNQPQHGTGSRNLLLSRMVEDPNFKDSGESFFIQAVDLVTFLLYQKLAPSAYIRGRGAQNHFDRLGPILCTHAATQDPQGIVRL